MATKYKGKYPNRIATVYGLDGGKKYLFVTNAGDRHEISTGDLKKRGFTKSAPGPGTEIGEVLGGYASNPAPRKTRISRTMVTKDEYINRPSQITRKAPTKRTKTRRQIHADAGLPPGYYPNPKPRFTQFVYDLQALNYGLGDWVTFGGANSLEVAEIMARAYADKRKVKVRVMDVTTPDYVAELNN